SHRQGRLNLLHHEFGRIPPNRRKGLWGPAAASCQEAPENDGSGKTGGNTGQEPDGDSRTRHELLPSDTAAPPLRAGVGRLSEVASFLTAIGYPGGPPRERAGRIQVRAIVDADPEPAYQLAAQPAGDQGQPEPDEAGRDRAGGRRRRRLPP